MSPLAIYITLILAGLLLLASEIFVPGGVVGTIGGLLLGVAAVMGFSIFGTEGGVINLVILFLIVCTYFVMLVRYLPRSFIGRKFTLSHELGNTHSADHPHKELVDREGVAQTDLRPSGIARIDGMRVDVMAEGSWIEKGARIRVLQVEGSHIKVRAVSSS